MKFSSFLFVLVLVALVMVAVLFGSTEARKKKGNKKVKPGVCKYERKGLESPCNVTVNTMEITLNLRKGDPATCQPTKSVSKACNDKSQSKKKKMKGCKYDRKGSVWSECDPVTNRRSKTMKLKAGSDPECPATKSKPKSCSAGNKKKGSADPGKMHK